MYVRVNKRVSLVQTALRFAVRKNCVEEVEGLISLGADVKVRDGNGMTPLQVAIDCNKGDSHFDTIELLLFNGADVNAQDIYAKTPLHHLACNPDVVEVVKLLLYYEADVNVKNWDNETPLWGALRARNHEMVKLLIDHGSDVNTINFDRSTPLHFACYNHNNLEIIKLFVKNGANINALDSEGLTPLFRIPMCLQFLPHLKFFLKYADTICVDTKKSDILDELWKTDLSEATLEHFAKLQALNLPIHPSILGTISERPKLDEYFEKCTQELAKAKSTKLKNCWVTFFNLLVDSKRKIKNYAGNQDLIEDFQSIDCLKNFPIYGAEINKKVEKGIKIRELFDKSIIILSEFLPIFNPNHLIIRDITDCLQKEDYSELAGISKSTKRKRGDDF